MTSELPADARAHRHRWWLAALIAVVVLYLALTVAIIVGSPLDQLDSYFYRLHLVGQRAPERLSVELYVLIGQGVPASTIAALYAIRRCIKTRSWTPWVMFAIALFLLNASVGLMKHATGRIGPKWTSDVYRVLEGGTIFPSGHAANAIVMYGLIAMIAPAAHRRVVTTVAVVLSMTIGLGTVALNTHWISDVFGGWLAGALVLLVVPPLTRPVDRLVTRTANRWWPVVSRWWASTPFRPLGTPKPDTRRTAPITEADSVAGSVASATATPVDATDVVIVTSDPRTVGGGRDARRAQEPPARRTGERTRISRHPATGGTQVTLGARSPFRDHRHHSVTQGS